MRHLAQRHIELRAGVQANAAVAERRLPGSIAGIDLEIDGAERATRIRGAVGLQRGGAVVVHLADAWPDGPHDGGVPVGRQTRVVQYPDAAGQIPRPPGRVLEDHGVLPAAYQPVDEPILRIGEMLAFAERQFIDRAYLYHVGAVVGSQAAFRDEALDIQKRLIRVVAIGREAALLDGFREGVGERQVQIVRAAHIQSSLQAVVPEFAVVAATLDQPSKFRERPRRVKARVGRTGAEARSSKLRQVEERVRNALIAK